MGPSPGIVTVDICEHENSAVFAGFALIVGRGPPECGHYRIVFTRCPAPHRRELSEIPVIHSRSQPR